MTRIPSIIPTSGESRLPTVLHSPLTDGNPVRYFLSFLLPPVAVLLCGKPILALLNLILTLLGYIPGVVHALLVVNDHKRDLRVARHVISG